MKILADCPDSATPTLALPPAWGRGGWGGIFVPQDGKGDLLALLPCVSELGGWQPEAPPHQVMGEDLFSLINGGAEIFLKAGFSRAVSQAYIQAGRQPIQLEIYEMTGPDATPEIRAILMRLSRAIEARIAERR